MAETAIDKQVCVKCGAEVREGTVFCYSCGGRVVAAGDEMRANNGSAKTVDGETKAALDDLAQKLKGDEIPAESPKTVAKAAEERKKARVTQRKTREFLWEPHNETPWALLVGVLIVLVAAVFTVLVTVVWK
jgi:uncharacterized Zn finger protein (UPF0148 family)